MAPREQIGQPDLVPEEEVLHLRNVNRQHQMEIVRLNAEVARRDQDIARLNADAVELEAVVARLNSAVVRLEADGVRRDQEAANLVLQVQELQQQVGQGKSGANPIILFVSLSKHVIFQKSFLWTL